MKNLKTPEDEAFDELAQRQGMWGGGFQAKRQAAMDKINSEFHEEYIKYRTAFPKEYTAPLPAQEPESLRDAVFTVLEGFTLPHDVRKILEAAYYTTSPKREWVGLTEEERNDIGDDFRVVISTHVLNAIEAKLKEKNFD
jgi:hypothetical protein